MFSWLVPNQQQLTSWIRTILGWIFGASAVAAFLSQWGIVLDANSITVIAGILAGLVGAAWSAIAHTKKSAVVVASTIVPIPVEVQRKVGITATNAVLTPTAPPALNKAA